MPYYRELHKGQLTSKPLSSEPLGIGKHELSLSFTDGSKLNHVAIPFTIHDGGTITLHVREQQRKGHGYIQTDVVHGWSLLSGGIFPEKRDEVVDIQLEPKDGTRVLYVEAFDPLKRANNYNVVVLRAGDAPSGSIEVPAMEAVNA